MKISPLEFSIPIETKSLFSPIKFILRCVALPAILLTALSLNTSAQCVLTATANPKGDGCFLAEEQVRWQLAANVSIAGNNLTKSLAGNSWNAGAASTAYVVDGGSMYSVALETSSNRMIGLSQSSPNSNFNTIQYAFYMRIGGALGIYESGNNRGDLSTYANGDTLRIENSGGEIRYFKNQTLLRTVGITPSTPLLVDCSIHTSGGTLQHVHVANPVESSFTALHPNAGITPAYAWSLNGSPDGTNSPNYTPAGLNPGDLITCAMTPGSGSCAVGVQNANSIRILPRNSLKYNDFYITGTVASSGCQSSREFVEWNQDDLTNVGISGNGLIKTQNSTGWDGDAFSINAVHNNGYFEFSTAELSRKAAGLSNTNTNGNFNTINYAFFFEIGGNLRIYENGTDRGSFGTYAPNDIFRIAVEAGEVKYYKNGTLLRISSVSPTLPLRGDVSLRDLGSTITNTSISNFSDGNFTAVVQNAGISPSYQWKLNGANVGANTNTYSNATLTHGDMVTCELTPDFANCAGETMPSKAIVISDEVGIPSMNFHITGDISLAACNAAKENVVWNPGSLTHNQASGNNLLKIQSNGNWDGNASSINQVGDNGYFEFTNSEISRKTIGLSDVDGNSNFNSIDYALYFESNGNLRIYESGIDRGNFGSYAIADVYRITVESGVVKYYRNGALLRISSVPPNMPLIADVSLRDIGATVTNAQISNSNAGSFTASIENAGPSPTFQWKVNGVNDGTNANTYSNPALADGDIVTCEVTPDLDGCASFTLASSPISIISLSNPLALNFFITGEIAPSACALALENVVWDSASLTNVQATGNNLLKVQSNGNWNGGAASLNTVADNGYFEFENTEIARKMIGLSQMNADANYTTIGYAFYCEGNGNLSIYENGTNRGNFGSYQIGDVFRISIENGVVNYYQNGALIRISAVVPSPPLLVDVSLRDIGATVTNAIISNFNGGTFTANLENGGPSPVFQWKLNGANVGNNQDSYTNTTLGDGDIITCEVTPDLAGCGNSTYPSNEIAYLAVDNPLSLDFYITGEVAAAGCFIATEDVAWNSASLTNVDANTNNLIKVQSNGNWNGGAASLNAVSDYGYFEFTNSEITQKAVGLSTVNDDSNFNTIDYTFYFETNGNLRIYENGTHRGIFGTYTIGDLFRISVENNTVKYYRNGVLLRISTVAPSLPLIADVSLRNIGATVTNATIANFNGGVFNANVQNAGDNPTFQWKLNGVNDGTNDPTFTVDVLQDGDVITCELTPDLSGCSGSVYTANSIVLTGFDNPVSVSFYISGNPSTIACTSALEDVVWNSASLLNVEANGNNLVKVQGGNSWNGNASSNNRVFNNGYFEFTATETNRNRMVGLSSTDANSSYTSIRYAFYLMNNGGLRIYENGTNRGTFGTFQTNDVLRIKVDNGIVKYFRNGTQLRVSTLMPTLPLLADVSINQLGGTVGNAVIANYNNGTFTANVDNAGPSPIYQWKVNGVNAGTNNPVYTNNALSDGDEITCELTPDLGGCGELSYTSNTITKIGIDLPIDIVFYIQTTVDQGGYGLAMENVEWINASLLNVQASDNNLLKISSNNNWNGNAASHNTVKENGYFEFTATQTNRRRMVGLSTVDANSNYTSINYALDLNTNGTIRIYENGNNRGSFGTYSTGSVFRIAVVAGIVTYYHNGTLIYTSNVTPTLPLLADVCIRDVGGTVSNAIITNITGGTFTAHVQNAGASPSYQWKLNGANVGTNSSTYFNANLFNEDIITCVLTPDLVSCGSSAFSANTIKISGPNGTTNWTGVVSVDWHNSANWSDGVPNQFMEAIIPAGTPFSPSINSIAPLKDLEIGAGANLTTASSTMQVYGNIINNGSIVGGAGSVAFLGSGISTISGATTQFFRLLFNKATAEDRVILETDIEIIDETVFFVGIVETGSNEVRFLPGSDSREGLNASHIEGNVRKIGNDAFRFPVGRNGIYAPAAISAPAQVTDEFTATYFDTDPEEDGYTTSEADPGLVTISRCEHWIINREVGTSAVAVTLSFENVRSCGVTDPTELKVARWNGSSWQDHGYLTHTGDATSGSVTSGTPILNFSPFTLGSGSPVNPLPINLLSFEAKRLGPKVDIKWTTATEVNNDFFTLERSSDGANYTGIAFVPGAGTSSTAINYYHSDLDPLKGTSYYRLRQTDFDGTTKVYPAVSIHYGGGFGTSVYPNPTDGYVRISLPENDGSVTVRILSANGALVWNAVSEGVLIEEDLSALPPGMYFVETETKAATERFKLVIR